MQKTISKLRKPTDCNETVQSPVLSMHEVTMETNDSLLTGRNLWQNQTQAPDAIRLDQLGF